MKKNVYLIQLTTGSSSVELYFPYTISLLQSYCETIEEITKHYEFKDLIFKIDGSIEKYIDNIIEPDVVGISNYVWNSNRHLKLIKFIKERYPKCLTVVGGPNFPHVKKYETIQFFNDHPYIDLGVRGEGEVVFSKILLKRMNNQSFENTPGVYFMDKEKDELKFYSPERIPDLNVIPSPYISGYFERAILKNPDIKFLGTLETDRGCPFKCVFCDWGGLTAQKMKIFDIERVKKELDIISKFKVSKMQIINSNFGIFKNRDIEITSYLVHKVKTTGYPKKINQAGIAKTPTEKNGNLQIKEQLKELGDQFFWPRVSVQALNKKVLKALKRDNMNINQFKDDIYYKERMNQVDLIFPLHEYTFDSFLDDVFTIMTNEELILHVFPLVMLPNAPMNGEDYDNYAFETVSVKYLQENDVTEVTNLVISTNLITEDESRKCWMIVLLANIFLRYEDIQIYLCDIRDVHKKAPNVKHILDKLKIEPKEFFIKLSQFLEENTDNILSDFYFSIKNKLFTDNYRIYDEINAPQWSFNSFLCDNSFEIYGVFETFLIEKLYLPELMSMNIIHEQQFSYMDKDL